MSNLVTRILRKFPRIIRRDRLTTVSALTLISPSSHQLPKRLKRHKYYDRFLPLICKHLGSSPLIVDIGSNIGDTIVLISSVSDNCKFVCLEPDPYFYSYLEKNIRHNRLKAELFNKPISHIPAHVLIQRNPYNSTGARTTCANHASMPNSITYSELQSSSFFLKQQDVDLIKIDIDGYDHDALTSIHHFYVDNESSQARLPGLIYFELMLPALVDNVGLSEFESSNILVIKNFLQLGFSQATIFSNYGLPIVSVPLQHFDISQLVQYMFSSLKSSSDLVYFDILLSTPQMKNIVDDSIHELHALA